MNQCDLNNNAKKYTRNYEAVKSVASQFEPKGIFHSELLMVLTLVKELDISSIVESGRARGQSTEVIARICAENNLKFDSIEYDKHSPDVAVAEKRLLSFSSVCTLHYGDGFQVMPDIISDKQTLIIIDGPKGLSGLKLGLMMLMKSNVRAVLFHDTHRDAHDVRPILEKYFTNHLLFTDDYEYVQNFKYLDEDCWTVTNDYIKGYGPYKRPKKLMRSYAGTFTCVLNNNLSPTIVEKCLNDINKTIKLKNSVLYKILLQTKLLGIIGRLYWKFV